MNSVGTDGNDKQVKAGDACQSLSFVRDFGYAMHLCRFHFPLLDMERAGPGDV